MTKRPYLLIPLLATLPFLFYAFTGYGGHDFRFHVTAWLELHQAWRAHEFTLGWSSLSQFGYGDPRFTFYPPLSLLLGTALTFLLPVHLVPAVIPWLILTIAGLAMYSGAARLLPAENRLPASLAYMFNPYLLLTLIARYAVAEAWVQALFPLTFYFFYLAAARHRHRASLLLSLLLALGWLTNIPAAIILAYTLTVLAIVLAMLRRTIRPVILVAFSQLAGLLLAAFRLLPAFAERHWIAPSALLGYSFRDEMPTPHQHHILVLVCALFMLIAAAIALLSARLALPSTTRPRTFLITLLTLAAISVLFELPLSNPLWDVLPELPFVQFPFRFLFLLSLTSTLLLFSADATGRLRRPALALSAALALLPFLAFARLLPLNRFPVMAEAEEAWSQGFEGTPEYLPATATLIPSTLPPQCPSRALTTLPNERLLEIQSPTPCLLDLPVFFYPFWSATLDGATHTPIGPGPSGLLQATLPPGTHRIDVRFNPTSPLRNLASLISAVTLLVLLTFALVRKNKSAPAAP